MKQIQIKTYNSKPIKEPPKVDHHEMKAKVKALTGKTVRLFWSKNGWDHKVAGVIGKLYDTEFDFRINGSMIIKVKYDRVTNVELIK